MVKLRILLLSGCLVLSQPYGALAQQAVDPGRPALPDPCLAEEDHLSCLQRLQAELAVIQQASERDRWVANRAEERRRLDEIAVAQEQLAADLAAASYRYQVTLGLIGEARVLPALPDGLTVVPPTTAPLSQMTTSVKDDDATAPSDKAASNATALRPPEPVVERITGLNGSYQARVRLGDQIFSVGSGDQLGPSKVVEVKRSSLILETDGGRKTYGVSR